MGSLLRQVRTARLRCGGYIMGPPPPPILSSRSEREVGCGQRSAASGAGSNLARPYAGHGVMMMPVTALCGEVPATPSSSAAACICALSQSPWRLALVSAVSARTALGPEGQVTVKRLKLPPTRRWARIDCEKRLDTSAAQLRCRNGFAVQTASLTMASFDTL